MNSEQNTNFLGNISTEEFMREYWQKKPLLIRKAFPDFTTPLLPEELAGLSLEKEIESRIVVQKPNASFELSHGPFSEELFQQLPETNWTLLLQALDQFIPEIEALKRHFTFLPQWRLDDVMASFSVAGGSVGPHFDNYDVFLIQGYGKKQWQVGELCNHESTLLDHPSLRILANFNAQNNWILNPGDLLYLPPLLAHYGTAVNDSITYSIGFRAPSVNEVLTHFTDFISQFIPDEQRYTDANSLPCKQPSYIPKETLNSLQKLMLTHINNPNLLLQWFGQYMTEPRYPEYVINNNLTQENFKQRLHNGENLIVNPSARLAWSMIDDQPVLFSSGNSRIVSSSIKELIPFICESQQLTLKQIQHWLNNPESCQLLWQLTKQGSLLFPE